MSKNSNAPTQKKKLVVPKLLVLSSIKLALIKLSKDNLSVEAKNTALN
jgi:hypothetical protein